MKEEYNDQEDNMDNCSKKGIDKESIILLIAGIILLILLVIVVSINAEASIVILLCDGMLICTYKFAETFFDNSGIKKMKAFGWGLTILAFNTMINALYDNVDIFDAIILLAFIFIGMIVYIINYFKCKEVVGRLWGGTILIGILSMLALSLFEIRFFFWFFKILALFITCTFINTGKKTNRLAGMIIIIGAYVGMVVLNGFLNIELLEGRVDDGWRNYYTAVYNMYSLPELESINGGKNQIVETLANYILCRLMDAVLIGGLVNMISEKKKEDDKCNAH